MLQLYTYIGKEVIALENTRGRYLIRAREEKTREIT